MKRPLAIKILAGGAMATGTLAVFSGLIVAWTSRGMSPDQVRVPSDSWLVAFMLQHSVFFAILQAVVGGIVVGAGFSLLRLRQWAARVLEIVAWAVLAYVVVFTGIFVRELLIRMPPAAQIPNGFNGGRFVVLFSGFSLLFWGIPLVGTIATVRWAKQRSLLT